MSRLQKVSFCRLRTKFNVSRMLDNDNFIKNDTLDFLQRIFLIEVINSYTTKDFILQPQTFQNPDYFLSQDQYYMPGQMPFEVNVIQKYHHNP